VAVELRGPLIEKEILHQQALLNMESLLLKHKPGMYHIPPKQKHFCQGNCQVIGPQISKPPAVEQKAERRRITETMTQVQQAPGNRMLWWKKMLWTLMTAL